MTSDSFSEEELIHIAAFKGLVGLYSTRRMP